MTTRMLIDARHREETRVAVVKGNRIEEFDFESAERKQLKGNIYLAKVTRVEPSLQAAFIDYGGNRHGFLAFSEIHPDYYQIPKEDRDALLREEAEHAAEEAALRSGYDDEDDGVHDDEPDDDTAHDDFDADPSDADAQADDDGHEVADGEPDGEDAEGDEARRPARRPRKSGGDDAAVEDLRERRMNLRHRYKIQDVIRRRQVLLVQVVKEERGNKGAALTTYLSLAGRYCVLMPNTSHGGGISRKISNAGDRKRLKSIMTDLALPPSMGCIVRTAGLQRTKVEIKRDFDYLARLWDGIREKTLVSDAPALVYGDSDLIKRAIRDIYNKEIEEVVVEGEEGYRQAREFMKLLMPSHARRVKNYADPVPLFQRAHVEDQLAAMYHPVVQLKSGGYLVINPTEALVSIDINSGRSTREHSIEQTATATNLEAAQEIGRQLRLRDMAGLVVIDFIDMDNNSNVRKVEKAMKEALKNDRARIQVGRISSFGLMEMSRQRLRTGVLEASTRACPHCEGTGLVRTASSSGISALRLIEDEAARGRGSLLTLRASQEAAVYILNRKRGDIAEIEDRYGVTVEIIPDREEEGARMMVEASGPPPAYAPKFVPIVEEYEDEIEDEIEEEEVDEAEVDQEDEVEDAAPRGEARTESRDEGDGRKRRRRRGRRGRAKPEGEGAMSSDGEADESADEADDIGEEVDVESTGEAPAAAEGDGEGKRRRGRRGRRGKRRDEGASTIDAEGSDGADAAAQLPEDAPLVTGTAPTDEPEEAAEATEAKPRARRRPRARAALDATTPAEPVAVKPPVEASAPEEAAEPAPPVDDEAPAKPKRTRRKKADSDVAPESAAEAQPAVEAHPAAEAESVAEPAPKPKRTRRKKADVAVADAGDAAPAVASIEQDADGAIVAITANPDADASRPVATDAETDPDGSGLAADEAGPPRRGWWQRTFGA